MFFASALYYCSNNVALFLWITVLEIFYTPLRSVAYKKLQSPVSYKKNIFETKRKIPKLRHCASSLSNLPLHPRAKRFPVI